MLLEVQGLTGGYGKKTIIRDVSIKVNEGEIIGLFGHNAAGKTTTLKNIVGVLKPTQGTVLFSGRMVTGRAVSENVKDGLSLVGQERIVFGDLTVRDNLELGGFTVQNRADVLTRIEMVHEIFPRLKERSQQKARTLSGGEQRMLSIGMGLMVRPKLLLLDEPSLGLSPLLVQNVMSTIRMIQQTLGTSVILVEQSLKQCEPVVDRVYVMKMGRIILEESAAAFYKREHWWDLY